MRSTIARAPEMIWIDDLVAVEPAYLRDRFRPADQGLTNEGLRLALASAKPATRTHVLDHVGDDLRAALSAPPPEATALEVFEAQQRVVAVYFWEIVYRLRPDVYEAFSTCQDLPLEELFPAEVLAGRDVADIGAGTGKALAHLRRHAAHVWAIDPAEPMLDIARRKAGDDPRVSTAVGSFADIPLPESSVDVVVSTYAFQASEERGGARGLSEIARVLRPGGVALLAIVNEPTGRWLLEQGLRRRTASRPVRWTRPVDLDDGSLLARLLQIAGVQFDSAGRFDGDHLNVYEMTVDSR